MSINKKLFNLCFRGRSSSNLIGDFKKLGGKAEVLLAKLAPDISGSKFELLYRSSIEEIFEV